MYWEILFSSRPSGQTSVVVGPFTTLKEKDDFRLFWERELMTEKHCRGYYSKVFFAPHDKLAKDELAMPPKDFNGIPEFFRFTIK